MSSRAALVASVALHLAALGAIGSRPAGSVEVSVVTVPAAPADGPPVSLPPGPADFIAASASSPFPRADVDAPDREAARRGGGAAGATPSWTGREDREELRAQPWSHPSEYRLPRRRTARERATTEARARTPRPGLDASHRDRARRAGASPSASGTARAAAGAADPTPARPFVAAGAMATDAHRAREERARDDVATAQASDERHPRPFDLGRPRAGGRDEGVAGAHEDDGHARADRGAGAGGSPLDVRAGAGQPSTRARLQDDYFRRLHARVLERVRWPRELAVALEQGEVVVAFTLRRDGSVAAVRVARPSGFTALDEAVLAAIREASPFGPVPESIAAGREVRVSAPFLFENPILR
jgi:protein TonB